MNDDNRTLDQIKADDITQLEDLIKKAKEHWFSDVRHAMEFQGKMLFKKLDELGVHVREGMHPSIVDAQLKAHHVDVENRPYEDEVDKWRSGFYIYQHGVLVAWISQIVPMKKSILNLYDEYRVKSTVKP